MISLVERTPERGCRRLAPGERSGTRGGQAKSVEPLKRVTEIQPVSVAPLRGLIEGRPNFPPGSAKLHSALRSVVPSGAFPMLNEVKKYARVFMNSST